MTTAATAPHTARPHTARPHPARPMPAARPRLRTLATLRRCATVAAVALAATACAATLLLAPASARAAVPAPAPTTADAAPRLAIVVQDATALRAAPSAAAAQQAQLWQGDLLELRGKRLDHLQVYDHRRERAGYVKASQVRPLPLDAASAPQLLAVLRFLRDTPGSEPLGIAYAAAYLKAAPAHAIDAEPFDALGQMADRLARRGSGKAGGTTNAHTAAHLDAVAAYGVRFAAIEQQGTLTLCADGDAWRRVLALPAAPADARARAVLALTRPDCIDPALPVSQRKALDLQRAGLLNALSAAEWATLPEPLKNRLRLRRAGLYSTLAWQQQRDGEAPQAAMRRALDELAAVNKAELADDDLADHTEAALRVGASRWAALPAADAGKPATAALRVQTEPGEPGQTCVLLKRGADQTAATPLARRCTFGTVWTASASPSPDGQALALAVQPLAGWTELWVFQPGNDGLWTVDVLPPAAAEPGLGYAELAGWVPGTRQLLAVREACAEGRCSRRFELLAAGTLAVDRQASRPDLLVAFGKWAQAGWRSGTVSLR